MSTIPTTQGAVIAIDLDWLAESAYTATRDITTAAMAGALDAMTPPSRPLPTGRELYKARIAAGLTVRQLGYALDISRHAIEAAERDRLAHGDAATRLTEWFVELTYPRGRNPRPRNARPEGEVK